MQANPQYARVIGTRIYSDVSIVIYIALYSEIQNPVKNYTVKIIRNSIDIQVFSICSFLHSLFKTSFSETPI